MNFIYRLHSSIYDLRFTVSHLKKYVYLTDPKYASNIAYLDLEYKF